jgi:hypothetical protein
MNLQEKIIDRLEDKTNTKLIIYYNDEEKRNMDLLNFIRAFSFMITKLDVVNNNVFIENDNVVSFYMNESRLYGRRVHAVIYEEERE